ncbi:zinc knuckle CX2CX4HX4C containing protein [Tanacetum coccineum]
MEVVLKRRHVVLTDSEDEDAENSSKQGRNLQEEGLDEMVMSIIKEKSEEFETIHTRQNFKGGRYYTSEGIINTGFTYVNTAFEEINSGDESIIPSPKKGQREGKAVLEEKSQSKRTKKQIREEQASLAEIVRLQAQEEAENARKAKQQRQDALIEKRVQDEAKLEANRDLSSKVLSIDFSSDDFAKKMVELINEKKRLYKEHRERDRRNRPITQAEQGIMYQYMTSYLKSQRYQSSCRGCLETKESDVHDVTKDDSCKREEEFNVQQTILSYNIVNSLQGKRSFKWVQSHKNQHLQKLLSGKFLRLVAMIEACLRANNMFVDYKWVSEVSRMSNTSDKGTTFGDGAARVGIQLRSSPKVSTSSPLVSPSSIINVPRELYNIDVAATFGVPLTTVGDLQKLINDIDAGKHDELLSELTNEDRMETLEALGSICNSIKVDRNNADVIPCKVSYADDSINLNVDESTIPSDPIVQSVDINKSTSYAGVAGGSAKDQPNLVEKVSTRFEHTIYGYFIGKRMAFSVVEYYARNNWAKHGLKRIMMNSKGFFFIKFDSRAGLEAVLEGGPWLIHKSLIILKKWSMDTRLLKEELTRIPIWVKLHDVPIQIFEEDGIIGKHVMLDSYTSSMCNDSWGRSSFARCLIEVNSKAGLVDVVTIGNPSLSEDDFTKETIRVLSPPIVATSNVVTPNAEKTNDGFQTVGKKKKRKGKSKSTNGNQFTGPSVKQNVRYDPKVSTSAPKKGTTYVGYTSQSTPMLKTTGNSSKKDNLSMSNSFSALNEEEEEDEEDVENVYDESANLIQNTKAGGSSSFTAAAG